VDSQQRRHRHRRAHRRYPLQRCGGPGPGPGRLQRRRRHRGGASGGGELLHQAEGNAQSRHRRH